MKDQSDTYRVLGAIILLMRATRIVSWAPLFY